MIIYSVTLLCYFHFGDASYMIYHSQIQQDYMQMRRDYHNEDPLEFSNELRRIQICDKVLKANKYLYIHENVEFLSGNRESNSASITQQRINRYNAQLQYYNSGSTSNVSRYQYNEKNVLVGSTWTRMRIFLCTDKNQNIELYVTSGFRSDYAFLLTKFKEADESTLKIRSMLAPSPKVDTELSFVTVDDHPVLDNYFWQFFRERTSTSRSNYYQILRFMQLCSLADDEYKYFSVCSSVANSLNKHSHYQDLHLDIGKLNYIRKIPPSGGCVTRSLIDQTGGTVSVRVLPCAVNCDWSAPQFYLLRDPNFAFQKSVFVLKPHLGGVLTLIAYVNDVNV